MVGEGPGQLAHGLHRREDAVDLAGDRGELAHHRTDLVAPFGAAYLAEVERHEVAGDELGEEGLGGGDGDLGPGVRVEDGVGLARDRRAVRVADGEHLRALFAGVPQRHQGVHGLAGLRDGDDEGALVEDRVPVAELAGEFGLAGQPGPVLDGVLGDHPGVEGGSAGDDDDLVDLPQFGGREAHLVEVERALPVDPAEEGVGDGPGLVGDLLEHEGGVSALLGGGRVPVDVVRAHLGGLTVEPGDDDALAAQLDDLVLAQLDGRPGVRDERGDVRGEEPLVLPHADDER